MGNRYEQFYGYTGLFPIRNDAHDASNVAALRSELAALPYGVGSMFSRTRLVHAARMFVIEDVVDNGHPSREEHLAYPYLAMSLTFDGELSELSSRIAALSMQEFDRIFSHCHGYGRSDSHGLLGYLIACQVETTFLYVDVGDASLERTLKALAAQRLIADLIVAGQDRPVAERKSLVRALAARMATLAAPQPGGFQNQRADRDGPR
jgi:hypothetical protein